jgi:erythromycin esterase-like protein
MMNVEQMKERALADQDQDIEQALAWWRATAEADKIIVWAAIQRLGGDPLKEAVSRLAQFGFTSLMLMAEERGKEA